MVKIKEKQIFYYDPKGNENQTVLQNLENFYVRKAMDLQEKNYFNGWSKENVLDGPRRINGSDCGVFCSMWAEHLCRSAPTVFGQDDMPHFREKMIIEISTGKIKGKLLYLALFFK